MSGAIGVILDIGAAASTALSMCVQRYALTYPAPADGSKKRVPLLCCRLPSIWVWLFGLLLYGIGTGLLWSMAGLFISLNLLTAIFITLLVFNLFFSRWLLKEKLTPNRVIGALIILLGAGVCAFGSVVGGDEAPTEYTPEEVEDFFKDPGGCTFFVILTIACIAGAVFIGVMDRKYPADDLIEAQHREAAAKREEAAASASSNPAAIDVIVEGGEEAGPGPAADAAPADADKPLEGAQSSTRTASGGSAEAVEVAPAKAEVQVERELRLAPHKMNMVMAFIYPASLGISESLVHVFARAFNGISNQCGDQENCDAWIYPFLICMQLLVSVIGALWWMRVVYQRYEVTRALPIEYGACAVADFASGLIFFDEVSYMKRWGVAVSITGMVIIVGGIALTLMKRVPGLSLLPACCTSNFQSLEETELGEAPEVELSISVPKRHDGTHGAPSLKTIGDASSKEIAA